MNDPGEPQTPHMPLFAIKQDISSRDQVNVLYNYNNNNKNNKKNNNNNNHHSHFFRESESAQQQQQQQQALPPSVMSIVSPKSTSPGGNVGPGSPYGPQSTRSNKAFYMSNVQNQANVMSIISNSGSIRGGFRHNAQELTQTNDDNTGLCFINCVSENLCFSSFFLCVFFFVLFFCFFLLFFGFLFEHCKGCHVCVETYTETHGWHNASKTDDRPNKPKNKKTKKQKKKKSLK